MSARIAHEIRNPLTGLKLHLQMLDERATPADRPTLRRLLDEVGRLELIVASSLSMTRTQPVVLHEADVGGAVDVRCWYSWNRRCATAASSSHARSVRRRQLRSTAIA